MKTMRLILGDRWSAGAIAVLIAQVLLLQGIFTGLNQSAMAGPASGPAFVGCFSHEMVTADAVESEKHQAGEGFHCPCAILCQLASVAVLVVPADFTDFVYATVGEKLASYPAPVAVSHPMARGLITEPRGPPTFSV